VPISQAKQLTSLVSGPNDPSGSEGPGTANLKEASSGGPQIHQKAFSAAKEFSLIQIDRSKKLAAFLAIRLI